MTGPEVTRAAWLAARKELLVREKAHMRARDELAAARRALPRVRVDTAYHFDSQDGRVSLSDLFAGRRQLAVYHFMFGADWTEGCKSCSFWADNLDGTQAHLARRDTSLVLVSTAPLARLLAYRDRMGWSLPWVSAGKSEFNRDFGVTFTGDELSSGEFTYNYVKGGFGGTEAPGLSCFLRGEDGAIYHSYSTYARGLDHFNGAYQLLDLTPLGRQEDHYSYPMEWLRRRDEYLQAEDTGNAA